MNMVMIYQNPQPAPELLSNFQRLPVKNSEIYEPNLAFSLNQALIVYNDSSPEFALYLETVINSFYTNEMFADYPPENKLLLVDLASDPLSAWQSHIIDVRLLE